MRLLCTVLFIALGSSACPAQFTKFFSKHDFGAHYGLKSCVSAAGDVNADGVSDFMVGSPGNPVGASIGRVEVFSGATRALLYTFFSPIPGDGFGQAVSEVGDVNNDGFDDILVGSPQDDTGGQNSGAVRVYSGADGVLLHEIFGSIPGTRAASTVCGLGDINGDGFDDFAAGAPEGVIPFVVVVSGQNGALIRNYQGASLSRLGASLANAGDVNNDGVNDLIIGEPGHNIGLFFQSQGRALIYDGANGSLIRSALGVGIGSFFGLSVDGVGDLNADGYDDYVAYEQVVPNAAITGGGQGIVFSGIDGSVLLRLFGDNPNFTTGAKLAGIGDITGDGIGDIAAVQRNNLQAKTVAFSGANGQLLGDIPTFSHSAPKRQSVDAIGDLNGDGKQEVIVGTFLDATGPSFSEGEFRVYFGGRVPVLPFTSNSGNAPALSLVWQPLGGDPNADFGKLCCSNATPGANGLILGSLAKADIPIFGFDLLAAVDPFNLLLQAGIGANFAGEFIADNIDRRNPFLAGSKIFVQFIEISPMIQASNGIRFVVIP